MRLSRASGVVLRGADMVVVEQGCAARADATRLQVDIFNGGTLMLSQVYDYSPGAKIVWDGPVVGGYPPADDLGFVFTWKNSSSGATTVGGLTSPGDGHFLVSGGVVRLGPSRATVTVDEGSAVVGSGMLGVLLYLVLQRGFHRFILGR